MDVGDTECESDDSNNSTASARVLMGQVMLQQNVLRANKCELRENGFSHGLQYNWSPPWSQCFVTDNIETAYK